MLRKSAETLQWQQREALTAKRAFLCLHRRVAPLVDAAATRKMSISTMLRQVGALGLSVETAREAQLASLYDQELTRLGLGLGPDMPRISHDEPMSVNDNDDADGSTMKLPVIPRSPVGPPPPLPPPPLLLPAPSTTLSGACVPTVPLPWLTPSPARPRMTGVTLPPVIQTLPGPRYVPIRPRPGPRSTGILFLIIIII